MPELAIQKFLRETPDGLNILQGENYALNVRRHLKYPNLVLFKYNQIESDMSQEICCEARGLILDESNNWEVVSYPYKKFWSYGDVNVANINWETAKVYEKLDGSLMTLYFYRNEWHVATSGSPDASGTVGDNIHFNKEFKSFADLFWHTFKVMGYELPHTFDRDICFMFELCTPENRVVVPHHDRRLILHGARNIRTFKEYNPEIFANIFRVVKTFPLKTLEDIVVAANNLNSMESEGYVICDQNFNRVKVKSLKYVAIAHIKDNFSQRRIWELVRTGETGEFLTYFPEYKVDFEKSQHLYDRLLEEIGDRYVVAKMNAENKKAFALQIHHLSYSSILFALYDEKTNNVKKFLADMSILSFERMMENFQKTIKDSVPSTN